MSIEKLSPSKIARAEGRFSEQEPRRITSNHSNVLRSPRTPKDDERIRLWIAEGVSDAEILKRMKKNWRSEVITLAGKLHCADCLQPISYSVCPECGQPDERITSCL